MAKPDDSAPDYDREIYSRERDFGRGGSPYGWESYQPGHPPEYTTTQTSQSSGPSDETITDQIREGFAGLWDLDADDISIGVHDGVVTLRGWVYSLWEKRVAQNIAGKTPGVQKVMNQLQVMEL